jgi:hypothetical protein
MTSRAPRDDFSDVTSHLGQTRHFGQGENSLTTSRGKSTLPRARLRRNTKEKLGKRGKRRM